MKIFNVFILLFLIFAATTAFAQTEPKILAKAYNQNAFFCGYYPSHTGDSPDVIQVVVEKESFFLDAFMSGTEQFKIVETLTPGFPINFDMMVLKYYNDSYGEFLTTPGITRLSPVRGTSNTSNCQEYEY
jgi:hypothetical protein